MEAALCFAIHLDWLQLALGQALGSIPEQRRDTKRVAITVAFRHGVSRVDEILSNDPLLSECDHMSCPVRKGRVDRHVCYHLSLGYTGTRETEAGRYAYTGLVGRARVDG